MLTSVSFGTTAQHYRATLLFIHVYYAYCLYMYIMHIGKAKFGAALLYAVVIVVVLIFLLLLTTFFLVRVLTAGFHSGNNLSAITSYI